LALGYGGEEASEGGAEIVVGGEAAGEAVGNVPADFATSEGLGFLAGVEGADVGMAVAAGNAAVAAIGEGERTQGRTVFFRFDRRAANCTRGYGTINFVCEGRAVDLTCGRPAASGACRHGSLQKERFGI
jgi:hypothetical protein